MSKDHWDAILASAPLNATAGAVVGKGVHFEPAPDQPFTAFEWDVPPPLKSPELLRKREPNFVDFTGTRFGRLLVIGLAADSHDTTVDGSRGALWVCRCACGRYAGRRARSIKKASPDARCDHCNYTKRLRDAASGDNARRRAESDEARKW